MSGNGNSGGRTGLLAFLAVIAIALGIGFGFYLRSGTPDTADPATVTAEPATIVAPAPGEPSGGTPVQNGAVQAQGVVELVATDDPLYLSCLEPPLGSDETRDERVAFCNQQLKEAQAGTDTPASRQ